MLLAILFHHMWRRHFYDRTPLELRGWSTLCICVRGQTVGLGKKLPQLNVLQGRMLDGHGLERISETYCVLEITGIIHILGRSNRTKQFLDVFPSGFRCSDGLCRHLRYGIIRRVSGLCTPAQRSFAIRIILGASTEFGGKLLLRRHWFTGIRLS